MAVLAELEKFGLDVDLNGLIAEFLKDENDVSSMHTLKDAIDAGGLKSPKTMKAVGQLQVAKKLTSGLYKRLVALNERFEKSEVSDKQKPAEPVTEPETIIVEENPGEIEVSQKTDNVVEFTAAVHVDDDKVKALMKKEEERMRRNLIAKEAKIRDRLKNQAEKKAKRQGMTFEKLQEITALQQSIKANTAKMKDLREENRGFKAKIKELKTVKAEKVLATG